MPSIIAAYAAGLLFGLGLVVSQMVNPAKVIGFLDIFGRWDPSLAFVMGGAVAVSTLGYVAAKRRGYPLLGPKLEMPTRRDLDARLLGGAALFGVGWGLAGLCPGPALTILPVGPWPVFAFVAAMIAGMALYEALATGRARVTIMRGEPKLDG
jgi:uncharacterized protein